jgi:hypothetical protein
MKKTEVLVFYANSSDCLDNSGIFKVDDPFLFESLGVEEIPLMLKPKEFDLLEKLENIFDGCEEGYSQKQEMIEILTDKFLGLKDKLEQNIQRLEKNNYNLLDILTDPNPVFKKENKILVLQFRIGLIQKTIEKINKEMEILSKIIDNLDTQDIKDYEILSNHKAFENEPIQ